MPYSRDDRDPVDPTEFPDWRPESPNYPIWQGSRNREAELARLQQTASTRGLQATGSGFTGETQEFGGKPAYKSGGSKGGGGKTTFMNLGGIDFSSIFGDTLGEYGQLSQDFTQRYDILSQLLADAYGSSPDSALAQYLQSLEGQLGQGFESPQLSEAWGNIGSALGEGLPPEIRQALMSSIGQSFDRQQRGLTEQFAGQRGGALSAATAQLGGQEGLAIAQGESNLAGLQLDREQNLLGMQSQLAGDIAGMGQDRLLSLLGLQGQAAGQLTSLGQQKQLGLLGEMSGLLGTQANAELGLLGQKSDFITDFANIGVNLENLDQNQQQFADELKFRYAGLNQNQRQFAATMLLDERKFEESIRQFNEQQQQQLKMFREQIQAGNDNAFWQALGTLGGAATAAIISDRNAKENIKIVGQSVEGIPIVEFNYKGEPNRWRGVIAQDVEKIVPNAVELHNGIKYVDYSRISVNMERCHG